MIVQGKSKDFFAYSEKGFAQVFIACGDVICYQCAAKSGDDCEVATLGPGERLRCVDCGKLIKGE